MSAGHEMGDRWLFAAIGLMIAVVVTNCLIGCSGDAHQSPDEGAGPSSAPRDKPKMPEFPFPPPVPAARQLIDRAYLVNTRSTTTFLRDVDKRLADALAENGYSDIRYYALQGGHPGFALAARLERIEDDGTPKEVPERWSLDREPLSLSNFSLGRYMELLLGADPGRYRVIVFLVTSEHVVPQGDVTADEADAWMEGGWMSLDPRIGAMEFTNEFECTALIYEFERKSEVDEPTKVSHSNITGRDHLQKSGLWRYLTNER